MQYMTVTQRELEFYMDLFDAIKQRRDVYTPGRMKAMLQYGNSSYVGNVNGVIHIAVVDNVTKSGVSLYIKTEDDKIIRVFHYDSTSESHCVSTNDYVTLINQINKANKNKAEIADLMRAINELDQIQDDLLDDVKFIEKSKQSLKNRLQELL